jgi:hypothetical protein
VRDVLGDLAARGHQVVTAGELDAAGIDGNDVRRLRANGRLIRLFHGTYAVPPVDSAPFPLACRGALRYAGAGAALVGETALAAFAAYPAPLAPEVAVPRERYVRSTPGLTVRRLDATWLARARDVHGMTVQDPATAVVWAWTRLGSVGDRRAMLCAAAMAGVRTAGVRAATLRLPRVARRAELFATCEHVDDGCESPAEIEYLLDVERRYGLPPGQRQAVIEVPGRRVRRVDVRYGSVVVEVDGGHHAAQRAEDEVRDVVLAALGFRVVRTTLADIRRAPWLVAATVARAIADAA